MRIAVVGGPGRTGRLFVEQALLLDNLPIPQLSVFRLSSSKWSNRLSAGCCHLANMHPGKVSMSPRMIQDLAQFRGRA
jgi:hypothetical protein